MSTYFYNSHSINILNENLLYLDTIYKQLSKLTIMIVKQKFHIKIFNQHVATSIATGFKSPWHLVEMDLGAQPKMFCILLH